MSSAPLEPDIFLINPCLVSHVDDFHSSGIPYMPHGLAYCAAVLKQERVPFKVLDLFAEAPFRFQKKGRYIFQGQDGDWVCNYLPRDRPSILIFYASSVFNGEALIDLLKTIKSRGYDALQIVIENTQAVTGFALDKIKGPLFSAGADALILGEPEAVIVPLVKALATCTVEKTSSKDVIKKFPNVLHADDAEAVKQPARVEDLDKLPVPAWEEFPLAGYWNLGVSHAPFSGPYLAILSSRGCPFPCDFCSVPVMNQKRWRARSVDSLIAELMTMNSRFGINEFHFEDVNPTVHEKRILEFCHRLIENKLLNFIFKIASGTKLDKFSVETVDLMARVGFRYVSLSPESGSPKVLKAIGKPFEHEKVLQLVKRFHQRGVQVQACFIVGHPSETTEDLEMTKKYIHELVKSGVGEIAVFMICPMPGTALFHSMPHQAESLSDLTFTPKWRQDFNHLNHWRKKLYLIFFISKCIYSPWSFFKSALRGFRLRGPYKLKMEMLLRRLYLQKKKLPS